MVNVPSLGVMWLPGLVFLLHQATSEATYKLIPEESNSLTKIGLGLATFVFFPLIPTILYTRVLLNKRRYRSAQAQLIFHQLEANSHEIRAIAGAIESPLEVIVLLWLVLRGILQLPWDRPLDSSCVEDSLGRVACLPSLLIASVFFSLLSILKTLHDLNIAPLLTKINQTHSVLKASCSVHLMAQFCPFFLCNIFFRTAAFAFTITYLDYWAIIPGLLVFLLILAHTTLLDGQDNDDQQTKENQEQGEENSQLRNLEAIHNDTRSSCSQDEDEAASAASNLWPVFLNSCLGIFLPMAYCPTGPDDCGHQNEPGLKARVKMLSGKQARILRSQAFLVNTCTLVVVIVIYFLVQHTTTFNYRSNILTPWWFKVFFSYLLLLFALSSVFSWSIEPPCLTHEKPPAQFHPPPDTKTPRSRRPTGESSCISVHSASCHLVTADEEPTNLAASVLLSFLLTLIILAPSILGVVLFKTLPVEDYNLVQTHEGKDGTIHHHLTHLVSLNPSWNGDQVESSHLVGCETAQNFSNLILLLNLTIPACRSLHRRLAPEVFGLQPPLAVIILDSSPEILWRLSSPTPVVNLGPALPVFMARTADWNTGWKAGQVTVVRGQEDHLVTSPPCLPDGDIYVGDPVEQNCLRTKSLHEDGMISETHCIRRTCSQNAMPCFQSEMRHKKGFCKTRLGSPLSIRAKDDNVLEVLKFVFNKTNKNNICCKDSSNYLKYFGRDCKKIRPESLKDPKCNFTDTFALYPCSINNQQEHIKLCKISGLNCVATLSYTSNCNKSKPFHCDFEDLSCDIVSGLKLN